MVSCLAKSSGWRISLMSSSKLKSAFSLEGSLAPVPSKTPSKLSREFSALANFGWPCPCETALTALSLIVYWSYDGFTLYTKLIGYVIGFELGAPLLKCSISVSSTMIGAPVRARPAGLASGISWASSSSCGVSSSSSSSSGPWSSIEIMLARFGYAAAASCLAYLFLLRLRLAFRFFGGMVTGAQAVAAEAPTFTPWAGSGESDAALEETAGLRLSLKLGSFYRALDACAMLCCFSLNISSKLFINKKS